MLLCDRTKLGEIDSRVTPYRILFEARQWVLLTLL
jgi:hypothetical protein